MFWVKDSRTGCLLDAVNFASAADGVVFDFLPRNKIDSTRAGGQHHPPDHASVSTSDRVQSTHQGSAAPRRQVQTSAPVTQIIFYEMQIYIFVNQVKLIY